MSAEAIVEANAAAPVPEPLLLSHEQRKEYLGRLAEFEIKLSALTDRQAAYVLALLQDPTNCSKAARLAGFKHPNIDAVRLNKIDGVQACLALGHQLREDRTLITKDRTLHELAILAFSNVSDYEVDDAGRVKCREGVPEYAMRAVSSVEFDTHSWTEEGETHTRVKCKIKLWSKNDALRMLAIYQKLLAAEAGATHTTTVLDNSKHVHVHQHQHNTWQWGQDKLTF